MNDFLRSGYISCEIDKIVDTPIFSSCGVMLMLTLILLLILIYTTGKIKACYRVYDPVFWSVGRPVQGS